LQPLQPVWDIVIFVFLTSYIYIFDEQLISYL